jgi:hypothetical protein
VNGADAIVVGSITRHIESLSEGPYFATPDPRLPLLRRSYYAFDIEAVVLDDGRVGDMPILLMAGEPGDGQDRCRHVQLPETGERYAFFLSLEPDGMKYAVAGPWALLSLDGQYVTSSAYGGTQPKFARSIPPERFIRQVEEAAKNYTRIPWSFGDLGDK